MLLRIHYHRTDSYHCIKPSQSQNSIINIYHVPYTKRPSSILHFTVHICFIISFVSRPPIHNCTCNITRTFPPSLEWKLSFRNGKFSAEFVVGTGILVKPQKNVHIQIEILKRNQLITNVGVEKLYHHYIFSAFFLKCSIGATMSDRFQIFAKSQINSSGLEP